VRWTKAPPIRRFFFAVTSPPVEIRIETADDAAAVARVVEEAFGRPDELRMVEAVRASPGFVPELAFVADDAGVVVGHVMLSWVGLVGSEQRLLELAPLAVAPARQREGIGTALARAALAAADARGVRFGFRRSDTLGIEPPAPAWHAAFMAAPLAAYDPSLRGKVVFPPSFSLAL
jgi:putative acetyltransferase